MLLAVEGGGFFSASASGYSKGLALLLLGQSSEEKPMRVLPWNHYQLVDQDLDPALQLDSGKNRLVRGCASLVCFGRAAAGRESPSPQKVGPVQQYIFPRHPVSDKGKDDINSPDVVGDENNAIKIILKGSLKKPTDDISFSRGFGSEHEEIHEKVGDIPGQTERRKVQWTDTFGGELVEIREFESSDADEYDDELDDENGRTCSCKIM